ncbi:MAG TPA: HNH endonuclease [Roseateles sp.]|uniref:HNH endonuclease n=1 Tax=Roseateles sp. TaxID=1971397 RepID=UPI002EDA896D
MHDVLQLDITGLPQAWISVEQAATLVATDAIVWSAGERPLAVLRGGINIASGRQSVLEVPPIVALRGSSRLNLFDIAPAYSKGKVIKRDRNTCAYCSEHLDARLLTVDHIVPASRGGRLTWMNTVAACRACNSRKADRTPDEARMPLLFAPFVPSRFEDFILKGRHIRADVHDWLAARLPKGSRLS